MIQMGMKSSLDLVLKQNSILFNRTKSEYEIEKYCNDRTLEAFNKFEIYIH